MEKRNGMKAEGTTQTNTQYKNNVNILKGIMDGAIFVN
jgi:hypothetical protein